MSFQRLAETASGSGFPRIELWIESRLVELLGVLREGLALGNDHVECGRHMAAGLGLLGCVDCVSDIVEHLSIRLDGKHLGRRDRPGTMGVLVITESAHGGTLSALEDRRVVRNRVQSNARELVRREIEPLVERVYRDPGIVPPERVPLLPSPRHVAAILTRHFCEGTCVCGGITRARASLLDPKDISGHLRVCLERHAIAEFSGGLDKWGEFASNAIVGPGGMILGYL